MNQDDIDQMHTMIPKQMERGTRVYNKLHGHGTVMKYRGFEDYTIKWDSGKITMTNVQFLKRVK